MRISILGFLLCLIGHSVYAQIIFEKGYFITKAGTRTECLIKNLDWRNNPTEFEYRMEGSETKTMQVLAIREFGVYDQSKYKTVSVNIDRSVFKFDEISGKNPVFRRETLALKVLVEGTASLYYYESDALTRFFFAVNDTLVEQLVYKEYLVNASEIAKNEQFKQQLWTRVNCGNVQEATVKRLRYDKKMLTDYFEKFNQCSGDRETVQKVKRAKSVFIKLTPGVGLSTLTITNSYDPPFNNEFGNKITYHAGVEMEFILPFNKNKWSLLLEPSYNTFSGSESKTGWWENETENNTFEIALGARHYFFLGQDSKIFLDGMFICYVPTKETIQYVNLQAVTNFGGAAGAGYAYKRASMELRYYINHETLANYSLWSGKQMKTIIVLGYRIF